MLGPLEVFGLSPLSRALAQARVALRGDGLTPPSRFDLSSTRMLDPKLALPIWLGRRTADRRVPIFNLFNRTPTPLSEGWSVRVRQVRDFRGGRLTYDSHNGTDFCVPVGTRVVSAAPGRVLRVANELHRGGLKVFVDHGRGLVTSYNHLARVLVAPGTVVARGETIALSGASGVELVLLFPLVVPHVHFNVWLNGAYVDPFAAEPVAGDEACRSAGSAADEASLWRGGANEPLPDDGTGRDAELPATDWDHDALERTAASCRHPETRAALDAERDPERRAMAILHLSRYFPAHFTLDPLPAPYRAQHPRVPWLDLPFHRADFVGVRLPPA
ncbi:MAG: M23 family metallopeptidase [Polyangiales bacterium]